MSVGLQGFLVYSTALTSSPTTIQPSKATFQLVTHELSSIPSSAETWSTLAAAREYPLFGQNTTVSSNQAIRIYAAASVPMSQQTRG